MEKIYRQGNAYFDTYYIHTKNGYIGILEHHCRVYGHGTINIFRAVFLAVFRKKAALHEYFYKKG